MQRLSFLMLLVSALVLMPGISSAQSCDYTRVYQELSREDTLNSQGTSLGEAFAVFQQDRFYVNHKNKLDRGDKPDEIMVNRNSRAKYGQAIRYYMNTHGMADIQINDVIGNQYIVELEVCGAQDNPSLRVTSLSVRSEQQDNGKKIDIEPLLKKLIDLENRLNQREDEWQKQEKRFRNTIEKLQNLLAEQEREISNLQFEIKKLKDTAILDGSSKQELGINKKKTTKNAEATRVSDRFCSKATGWTTAASEWAARRWKTSKRNVGFIKAEKNSSGQGCRITFDTPQGPTTPLFPTGCVYKIDGEILLHISDQCILTKAPD